MPCLQAGGDRGAAEEEAGLFERRNRRCLDSMVVDPEVSVP